MATSALHDVLTALADRFTTALAADDAAVFDGPSLTASSEMEAVVVGCDDAVPSDFRSGREMQAWSTIGGTSKKAEGSVMCSVFVGSGHDLVPTVRARAFAILALCETALRNDIDLDGGKVLYTGLSQIDLRQQATTSGTSVRIVFAVNYRARL